MARGRCSGATTRLAARRAPGRRSPGVATGGRQRRLVKFLEVTRRQGAGSRPLEPIARRCHRCPQAARSISRLASLRRLCALSRAARRHRDPLGAGSAGKMGRWGSCAPSPLGMGPARGYPVFPPPETPRLRGRRPTLPSAGWEEVVDIVYLEDFSLTSAESRSRIADSDSLAPVRVVMFRPVY